MQRRRKGSEEEQEAPAGMGDAPKPLGLSCPFPPLGKALPTSCGGARPAFLTLIHPPASSPPSPSSRTQLPPTLDHSMSPSHTNPWCQPKPCSHPALPLTKQGKNESLEKSPQAERKNETLGNPQFPCSSQHLEIRTMSSSCPSPQNPSHHRALELQAQLGHPETPPAPTQRIFPQNRG